MKGFLSHLVDVLGLEVDHDATTDELGATVQEGAEDLMHYAHSLEGIIRKLCASKGATLTESEQETLTAVLQGGDFVACLAHQVANGETRTAVIKGAHWRN